MTNLELCRVYNSLRRLFDMPFWTKSELSEEGLVIEIERIYDMLIERYSGDRLVAVSHLPKGARDIVLLRHEDLMEYRGKKLDFFQYHKTPKKKNRDKSEYVGYVWKLTEANKHLLNGIEKRDFRGYHIDHIVPISYGYKHNIPPELIASIDNLRMLKDKENMKKAAILTQESIDILKKWGIPYTKY